MNNLNDILAGLQGALDLAQNLAPAAEALGLPASVAGIAGAVSAAVEVAENVVSRIQEGEIVASNDDAATVRAILANLQDENDKLAAKIAAS